MECYHNNRGNTIVFKRLKRINLCDFAYMHTRKTRSFYRNINIFLCYDAVYGIAAPDLE